MCKRCSLSYWWPLTPKSFGLILQWTLTPPTHTLTFRSVFLPNYLILLKDESWGFHPHDSFHPGFHPGFTSIITTGSDFAIIYFPWQSWRQGEVDVAIILKILMDRKQLCQWVWTSASLLYFISTWGLFCCIRSFCVMLTCSFRRKKSENSRGGIKLDELALLLRSSEAKSKTNLTKWSLKWLKLITTSGKVGSHVLSFSSTQLAKIYDQTHHCILPYLL